MYESFEDLRDNCPARVRAAIAIDLEHDDPARLDAVWPATADGGFRMFLTGAVRDFWEEQVRSRGKAVPDDAFAIEIVVDSFTDRDMGSTLYLELVAYCGTEGIGDLTWDVFEDDPLERKFAAHLAAAVPKLLADVTDTAGVRCEVEVTEVEEL